MRKFFKTVAVVTVFSISEKFLREECKNLYDYSESIDEVLDYVERDKCIEKDVHDLKFS